MGSYFFYILVIASLIGNIPAAVLECETDADCIDEANCSDGLCQCPDGYVFSINGYQCLKHSIGYLSSCEDDAQCSWLMGKYYCNSGACDCDDGYRYLHGRCVQSKGIGESCTRDEECHVNNDLSAMICSEGICACNDGYYSRGEYDCRREANEIADICALDSDCKVEDGYCHTNATCITSSAVRTNQILSGMSSKNTLRDAITYAIGTSCSTSEDCQDVPNSICSPLTAECVCKRGYFYSSSSSTCVGEVGIDIGCTSSDDCTSTTRNCQNGACVCPQTHYYNDALTGCVRVAVSPTFSCASQVACRIIGQNALCVLEEFLSFCYCPLGYQLNEDIYVCEEVIGGDTNDCVIPSDCSIVNAVCTDGVCGCASDYRLVDDVCLPNLGATCDSSTRLCELENADCTNNVCSCHAGYTAVDETNCVDVVSGLYEDCQYDNQCSFVIANSICSGGQCNCIDTYADKDGACVEAKAYGDYCVNVEQCQVALGENIQCRNSMCQCPADMTRTSDGLDCITRSSASTLKIFYLFIFTFSSIVYITL